MSSNSSPCVLALNGSPRRGGNTNALLQAAAEAAIEAGATTETIQLGGLTMAECNGCHACWSGRDCPKCDDMNALYPKIAGADGVLFGTPVYWYGVTGLMKLLIDRLVYFNCPEHRELVRGKPAGVVVPFEEDDPAMADGVLEMFRKSLGYLEMEFVGAVTVPGVTRPGEVREHPEALQAARDLARSLLLR